MVVWALLYGQNCAAFMLSLQNHGKTIWSPRVLKKFNSDACCALHCKPEGLPQDEPVPRVIGTLMGQEVAVFDTTPQISSRRKPIEPRYEFTNIVDYSTGEEKKNRKPIRKILKGMVVSARANKTIVVRVERRVMHKKYGKYIKKSSRIMAHDEENRYKEGDMVQIRDCRPLSKRKFFETVQQEQTGVDEDDDGASSSERKNDSYRGGYDRNDEDIGTAFRENGNG